MTNNTTLVLQHPVAGDIEISLNNWISNGPDREYPRMLPIEVLKDGVKTDFTEIPTLYRNNGVTRLLIGLGIYEDPWKHLGSPRDDVFVNTTGEHIRTLIQVKQASEQVLVEYGYKLVGIMFSFPKGWSAAIFALSHLEKVVFAATSSLFVPNKEHFQVNDVGMSDILVGIYLQQGARTFSIEDHFEFIRLGNDIADIIDIPLDVQAKSVYPLATESYLLKGKDIICNLSLIEPSVFDTIRKRPMKLDKFLLVLISRSDNSNQMYDALINLVTSITTIIKQ